jgi:hypothetical protein
VDGGVDGDVDGGVDGDVDKNAENEEINIAMGDDGVDHDVEFEVNVMETKCPICLDVLSTVFNTRRGENCDHEFCGFCVKKIIEKNNQPSCAFCRVSIEKIEVKTMNMECLFHDYKK